MDVPGAIDSFLKLYRECRKDWPAATYVLSAVLIIAAAALSYELSGGQFERIVVAAGVIACLAVLARIIAPSNDEPPNRLRKRLLAFIELTVASAFVAVVLGM